MAELWLTCLWQALVHADVSGKLDPSAALVVPATKGICFFGTPHNNINRTSWSASVAQVWKTFASQPEQAPRLATKALSAAQDATGARINIMFADLVRYRKIQILSFYEKRPTHTAVGKTLVSGRCLWPLLHDNKPLARSWICNRPSLA